MAKPAAASTKTAVTAAAPMVFLILIVKSYSPGGNLKTDEIRDGNRISLQPGVGMLAWWISVRRENGPVDQICGLAGIKGSISDSYFLKDW
jgi:hypothetical protein